jgi:hypothetical protein
MIVVSIDPSLRNTGIAVADYCELSDAIQSVERIELITTKPLDKKLYKSVKKNASDFDCALQIRDGIAKWTDIADVVITEMPVGSQSARASWCLGSVLGILTNIRTPLVHVQPSETKMVVGKNASKDAMVKWASELYPDLNWYRDKFGFITTRHNEHMADAIGVLHVGVLMPKFKDIAKNYTGS